MKLNKEELEMVRFALSRVKKNDCPTQADERRYADLIDKIDIANHVNMIYDKVLGKEKK